MDAPKGKVILFGKTGDGKSTVANALVTGGIDHLEFDIGHGVKGCTSEIRTASGRGWTVTDTVGLGEGEGGKVSNEAAEHMILEFLKRVRGQYTHVIYVKSSANRFDVLDKIIWDAFQRIFKGAEGAFTILFTKHDEGWLNNNWGVLPEWVHEIGRDNVLISDIPPRSERRVLEARNQETRRASIQKLEEDLLNAFQRRGGRYAVPDICTMNDAALVKESKSILDYIRGILSTLSRPMEIALSSVSTILAVFGLPFGI